MCRVQSDSWTPHKDICHILGCMSPYVPIVLDFIMFYITNIMYVTISCYRICHSVGCISLRTLQIPLHPTTIIQSLKHVPVQQISSLWMVLDCTMSILQPDIPWYPMISQYLSIMVGFTPLCVGSSQPISAPKKCPAELHQPRHKRRVCQRPPRRQGQSVDEALPESQRCENVPKEERL